MFIRTARPTYDADIRHRIRVKLSIEAIAHSQHLMSKVMPQALGSNSALKLSEE
ncbi:hypothetical protein ACF3DV_12455 [Chlorogloeopsis fritschii PCC 9212]|uniref:hypothetical protein n=1 Tax=Chlorogloeopsis fritschii TaxID=1124 RepID=UPI0012F6D203|nr:hypothetical protein [Chlorogloeopsis fritschii]